MKSSLLRFVLLGISALQYACAFVVHDMGFSVSESNGNLGPIVTEAISYWGEQNASRYQVGNYSLSLYAESYNSSTISLGVCPLPIIPLFGIFDRADQKKLKIVMRFWKLPKAAAEEIQILKAEVKTHENHYLPEKLRIIDISPSSNSHNWAKQTYTLSKSPPQLASFEAQFQYPIDPKLIDDFFLDIEINHSYAVVLKDTIHFKYSDYYLYGCIP